MIDDKFKSENAKQTNLSFQRIKSCVDEND